MCFLLVSKENIAQEAAPFGSKRSLMSLFENGVSPKTEGILAENTRSDSIDILDYHIDLAIVDFTTKVIAGNCAVTFRSKISDCSYIDLDLLGFSVDSVTQNNQQIIFTYSNNLLLRVYLLSTLDAGDSAVVVVYYHGVPTADVSGWGGFYFTQDYAYNLGVGFDADPHPFGRAWFPCFDNFVERSTFHFSITTADTKMALCNGALSSSIQNGNGTTTWNWEMMQTIPSYLACVAVGNYAPAYDSYYGLADTIPVMFGAIATDTTKMKNSFVHIKDALSVFENAFGPYRWNKVGYSLVPFSNGAMEHATNIAYPIFMANGTLDWESFYVHELSHHWFGDLVTCRTQEDMWLNEGWAVYCERLFLEEVYGRPAYDLSIADNHAKVVHYAHTPLGDGQYLPVSGVQHDFTYSTTVYDKGADMVHTLRGYLGDSVFFDCITNYLTEFAFRDAASEDLRDFLSSCSGIDLTDFFDDWIFNPGFPQFSIDSLQVSPLQNQYAVNVFIKQRLDHAPHYYKNVPLKVTFKDKYWNMQVEDMLMNGQCGIFSVVLPFYPEYAGLDLSEKISDAITAGMNTIKQTGTYTFTNAGVTLNVSDLQDSAFIRVEHNYVPPDPFKVPVEGLHISHYHYWKIDGILPAGFDASAILQYNGTSTTGGFLDNSLITNSEDSLVMLFRPSARYDWEILTDVVQNFSGSHSDKRGFFTLNHIEKGEYAWGIFDYDKLDTAVASTPEPCLIISAPDTLSLINNEQLLVYPVPTTGKLTISTQSADANDFLEIYNLYGHTVYREQLLSNKISRVIDVSGWPAGPYIVCRTDTKQHRLATVKIIIN